MGSAFAVPVIAKGSIDGACDVRFSEVIADEVS
jgi:hypothetical protein